MSESTPLVPGATPVKIMSNDGWAVTLLSIILISFAWLWGAQDWAHGFIFFVGALQGYVLFIGKMSFTSFFRKLFTNFDLRGLRSLVFLLLINMIIFAPSMHSGKLLSHDVKGYLENPGLQTALGGFIFSIGMQLGGGCASGVLYSVGGGSLRSLATFIFFVVGSVIGSANWSMYAKMPHEEKHSFVEDGTAPWAWMEGILIQAPILGVVWLALYHLEPLMKNWALEKKEPALLSDVTIGDINSPNAETHAEVHERPTVTKINMAINRVVRGPWTFEIAAICIALLNLATLYIKGAPWGITAPLSLWGGQILHVLGFDVQSWAYFQTPGNAHALVHSPLEDLMSLQNIGLMLGAMTASFATGRWANDGKCSTKNYIFSCIGGVMLGYGARMASGCNVGALLGGVSSSSLHGYLWFLAAIPGTFIGTMLRPITGKKNEKVL